jgi:hypothetical protein
MGMDAWMMVDAFHLMKQIGCPNTTDFGGIMWGWEYYGLMDGYDKWYKAMCNRIDEFYAIKGRDDSYVETAKNWIYDHADGSEFGGTMVIQTDGGSQEIHGDILLHTQACGGHGMTVVGYNDEIGWDYNGDGNLTNPGNDVSQWEKGAWLCIQSEGLGPYWMPYREIQENMFGINGNGGECGCDYMLLCRPKKDYSPLLTFKISISHNQRNKLKLETGVANGLDKSQPEHTKDYSWAFNFTGGSLPLGGDGQSDQIEIGLDLTDLLAHVSGNEATFFLKATSTGGSGKVVSLTLMDYTSGSENEIQCEQNNTTISETILMPVSFTGEMTAINSRKTLPSLYTANASITISPNPAGLHSGPVFFSLPGTNSTPVSICIRNITGRTVYSAILKPNENLPNTASWDLKDNNGRKVSTGAYLASISTGNHVNARGLATSLLIVTE